jgi:hypothetical protein
LVSPIGTRGTDVSTAIPLYNHPIADMTPEPKRPLKVFLCHAHAHADRDPVRGLHAGTRLTKVSNGLCRGLTEKSGYVNPRMYNCHKQAKVRLNP